MSESDSHASLRRRADEDHSRRLSDISQDKKLIREAVAQHEKHDHAGEKLTRLKFKHGGAVEGKEAEERPDRPKHAKGGRAGKKGGHTTVNVVMPQGGDKQPVPIPVPAGGGGPPAAMPPRPPMPPAGGPPMGAPPGGPGGPPPGAPMMRARGGRALSMPHLTGGAQSGEGRLERNKAMHLPKDPENKGLSADTEDKPLTGDAENRKKGGRA